MVSDDLPPSEQQISKDLICIVVEQALLKIGPPEFDLVKSKLQNDHQCDVSDCLMYPHYLKIVLSELYGDSAYTIVDCIEEKLQKVSVDSKIKDFLLVLKK